MEWIRTWTGELLSASERRAARQTAWLGARVAIQVLGGVIGMAFIARTLGAEGFGIFALFMAVTSLVGGLLYLPGFETITTYVTRSLAREQPEEAAATLRFALAGAVATGWLSYAAIVGLALIVGSWFGVADAHVTALLVYAAINIFQAGHMEFLSVLRLANRVRLAAAIMAAGIVVQVTMLAVAWWSDGGLLMVALAYAAGSMVYGSSMCIGALIAVRQASIPLWLRPLSLRVPRDVVRFQKAAFMTASLRAVYLNLDVLLVAQLVSASQLGLYRGARLLVDVGLRVFQPVSLAVQAEYSRHWYASDRIALRRLAGRFSLLTLTVAVAGYGLLAMLCGPIVELVLGSDFAGAVDPLLIMIPGGLVFAASTALYVLPAAAGRAWPNALAELLALTVQVVALYMLTPLYGATGAAWAYTAYALAFAAVVLPAALMVLGRNAGASGNTRTKEHDAS